LHHSNGTDHARTASTRNVKMRAFAFGRGGAAVKDPPVEERECRGG